MASDWKMPVLELGEVEAVAPDGTDGICYDEAVIFFKDGGGECSIDIECPAALRIAAFILKAVNNHEALVDELKEVALQLEYMQERLSTSTGVAVLSRIRHLLAVVESPGVQND